MCSDKLAVFSLWTVAISPSLRCSSSPHRRRLIDLAELHIAAAWMELINWLTDKRAKALLKVNVSPLANLLVSHHGEIKARSNSCSSKRKRKKKKKKTVTRLIILPQFFKVCELNMSRLPVCVATNWMRWTCYNAEVSEKPLEALSHNGLQGAWNKPQARLMFTREAKKETDCWLQLVF